MTVQSRPSSVASVAVPTKTPALSAKHRAGFGTSDKEQTSWEASQNATLERPEGIVAPSGPIPENDGRHPNNATFRAKLVKRSSSQIGLFFDITGAYPGDRGTGIWYGPIDARVRDAMSRIPDGTVVVVRLERGHIASIAPSVTDMPANAPQRDEKPHRIARRRQNTPIPESTPDALDAMARLRDTSRENVAPRYAPPPDASERRCTSCHRTMTTRRQLVNGKCGPCQR